MKKPTIAELKKKLDDMTNACKFAITRFERAEQQRDELQNRVDFLNEQNSAQQEENDTVKHQRDELLAELKNEHDCYDPALVGDGLGACTVCTLIAKAQGAQP